MYCDLADELRFGVSTQNPSHMPNWYYMANREQEFPNDKDNVFGSTFTNGVGDAIPSLIDFGEDEIWGFSTSKEEQISTTHNLSEFYLSQQQSRLENDTFFEFTATTGNPASSFRKSSYSSESNVSPQSTFDLLSDVFFSNSPSGSKPQSSTLVAPHIDYASNSESPATAGNRESSLPESVYPSHGNISPQSTLDLLSDVFSSNPPSASKSESSTSLAPCIELDFDDITYRDAHLIHSPTMNVGLSATHSSESLGSVSRNPFESLPNFVSSNSVESPYHTQSCNPFQTLSEPQLLPIDADFEQAYLGLGKLSIMQDDRFASLGFLTEDAGIARKPEDSASETSCIGSQTIEMSKDVESRASQQRRPSGHSDIGPVFDDLKEKPLHSMLNAAEGPRIANTAMLSDIEGGGNENLDLIQTSLHTLASGPHQKPKNKEAANVSICNLKEFVASGGGKGIFRIPSQEAIHPGRPAFLELRPRPLRETQNGQGIYTITGAGNLLWAGLESGIRFWDIEDAYSIARESGACSGDEDTAPFGCVPLQNSPTTCLFADATNNIVWSGHRDGKVRTWPLNARSDAVSARLMWQAHQGPVLSMVVTSYGELWTGSEFGNIRAWPWEVSRKSLSVAVINSHNAVSLMERSYIDLRNRGTSLGDSIPNTDVRFLLCDHSSGRVWSGGFYSLALWDAQTRDVLKVLGSDGQAYLSSAEVLSVQGFRSEAEMKMGFAKVSKKEKVKGPLSFFQRSRKAILGAADAVCRATLGGQFLDDSRKVQAIVVSVDGTIWTGYANGLLVHWDSQGNRVQEFQRTSVAVQCLCAFGTRLWIGYEDGRVQVMEQNGKVLKGWLAHSSAVLQMAVGSGHVFTLSAHGGIRGWNWTLPSPLESILQSTIIDMEPSYTRKEHIKILAGTWNVSQERSSFDSLNCWLASPASEASIVVIGLQEMEMGPGFLAMAAAKETVGIDGSANGHWWLDSIGKSIGEEVSFVRVGSRQLAGLLIGAWVRRDILPYVGDVDVGAVACGFGRTLGNKGAVAVKMRVFRRTICVLNCHFAAHMDAVARRNADFEHVYRNMVFGRLSSGVSVATNAVAAGVSSAVQMFRGVNVRRPPLPLDMEGALYEKDLQSLSATGIVPGEVMPELAEADMVIWLGDFNYRLDNISYEDAIGCIERKDYATLLGKDQLREEMKAGRVFQGMREGHINFPPTYKFDRGQSGLQGYDSSEKRRVPAWCDRIVFRDRHSVKSTKCNLTCPIVSSIACYEACMDVTESDHKPVRCMFNVDIAFIDEAARRRKYGDLLHSHEQIRTCLEHSNIVPNTVVSTNNIELQDHEMFVLLITNRCGENVAVFEILCEIKECVNSGQQHDTSTSCFGFPRWLQVTPASGIIFPGQTVEIYVQHEDLYMEEEYVNGTPQNWWCEDEKEKTMNLLVNVRGIVSTKRKQHQICVCH